MNMEINNYINKSKILSKKEEMIKLSVSFLSNFTINGLAESMKVICFENKIWLETYIAEYNQYAQEILDESSGLYSSKPNIIFIILDIENLVGDFFYFPYRKDIDARRIFWEDKAHHIISLLDILKKRTESKIVISSFLIPVYTSRGIIEDKLEWGLKNGVRYLNDKLNSLAKEDLQLFIFDINTFYSKYGIKNIYDPKICYLSDMKISPKAIVPLAKEYLGYIPPMLSLTKKCIVLDLDNTLWGGIIGEDGLANIRLGPDKLGRPYLDFQKRLLDLFERGIILAINSKNNYDDVIDVFKNHKYMLLKEDNFAAIKINWQDKVTNLKEIAKEINIGLDSIIFIDDDKTNREMIKEMLPEVMVIELPEDPCLYPKIIEDIEWFNLFSITNEDLNRGKMYTEQKKRNELESKITYIREFIIKAIIVDANEINIPRIAQLTQKTNQFNLTTKRYQIEDIERFIRLGNYLIKSIEVSDKFGDYGMSGVIIIKKDNVLWEIDSFLLSCRILGKNIELSFMESIINLAKKENVQRLKAYFIPTPKNKLTENLLEKCGFSVTENKEEKKSYLLELANAKKLDTFFEVKEWKH